MKNIKWIAKLSALTVITLIMTTACQQQETNPAKLAYQNKAAKILKAYSGTVSNQFAQTQQASSGSRGFGGGVGVNFNFDGGFNSPIPSGQFNNPGLWQGWNPFGGTPFGGQQIQYNIEDQLRGCVSLVANIPPAPQNFFFMVGSLARCLDMIVNYRNPLMTYGYRNLAGQDQQYWQYLINYQRPGTFNNFGNFNNQGFQPWDQFVNTGTFNNNGIPF